ncbi:hypothetical protein [Viridibacterium curvum]|uniref:ABC transporter permease n=1 Tax=Viridibacterium curvum TaxID=1101404 RepID=A0ABP9R2T0_9RHOO
MESAGRRLRLLATLAITLGIAAALLASFAGNYLRNSLAANAIATGTNAWLADNHGLMQIDAQGKLVRERSLSELGVKAISELHAIDATHLLLAEPGSARLKLLDANTGSASGVIPLAAPAPQAPIRLASRKRGQSFEIAAVLDGAVQRFDDQGKSLASSVKGEVRQAEGVLFDGEAWWVADSTKQQLTQLQADSLTAQDNVPLSGLNALRVPGIARLSRGQMSDRDKPAVATVIRRHPENGQTRVVDVFSDATEAEFPLPVGSKALDVAWLGKELWVLDGAQGAVWRFDAARKPLGKVNDPTLNGRLTGSAFWRSFAEGIATASRLAAIVCLSLGALLIAWLLHKPVVALIRRKLSPPEEVSDEEDWEARR